jgi:hypothetical protein
MKMYVEMRPRPLEIEVSAKWCGIPGTMLRAKLPVSSAHPRGPLYLLEGLSLWTGARVHAALVVDARGCSSATSLYRDLFGVWDTPLVDIDYVRVADCGKVLAGRTEKP